MVTELSKNKPTVFQSTVGSSQTALHCEKSFLLPLKTRLVPINFHFFLVLNFFCFIKGTTQGHGVLDLERGVCMEQHFLASSLCLHFSLSLHVAVILSEAQLDPPHIQECTAGAFMSSGCILSKCVNLCLWQFWLCFDYFSVPKRVLINNNSSFSQSCRAASSWVTCIVPLFSLYITTTPDGLTQIQNLPFFLLGVSLVNCSWYTALEDLL